MLYAYADNKNFYGDFDNTSACLSSITIPIILSGDYYHLFRWRTLLPGLPWILEGIFTIYSSILQIVAKYVSLPLYTSATEGNSLVGKQNIAMAAYVVTSTRNLRWESYYSFFWENKFFLGGNKNHLSGSIAIINGTLIWLLHRLIFLGKQLLLPDLKIASTFSTSIHQKNSSRLSSVRSQF